MIFWHKARRRVASTSVALVLVVGACGGGGGGNTSPAPIVTTPPTASFMVSSATGTVPLSVTFNDTSDAGTSAITTWEWDFGNGETSIEQNPTIEYREAGSFDVSLRVTTSIGSDSEQRANAISIQPSSTFLVPEAAEEVQTDIGPVLAAPGQVLVTLSEDASEDDLETVISEATNHSARFVAENVNLLMLQFEVPPGNELALAEALMTLPEVNYAGLNLAVQTVEIVRRNEDEPGYHDWKSSGGHHQKFFLGNEFKVDAPPANGITFPGSFWMEEINAIRAWTLLSTLPLEDSTIAIVDNGVRADQTVVEATRRLDRYDREGRPLTDNQDDDLENPDHGMHSLGFAAGDRDDSSEGLTQTVRGVDQHSDTISVDALERSSLAGVIDVPAVDFVSVTAEALDAAIELKPDVVNVSKGKDSRCGADNPVIGVDPLVSTRKTFTEAARNIFGPAIKKARRNDVIVVIAAGNDCYKSDDKLLANPVDNVEAAFDSNVLIVGASDAMGMDACFSRMGDVVDLVAPGLEIAYSSAGPVLGGTSYSAPMVAGTASLVRAVNGDLRAPEVKGIILNSARETLKLRDRQQNIDQCASIPAITELENNPDWFATGPVRELDLLGAIESAALTKTVDLRTLQQVALLKGETKTVSLEVQVPEEGVSAIDLVFLIDQSGSYFDDIDALQTTAREVIEDLGARSFDIRYAVAGFSDFPIVPFGTDGDHAYKLFTPFTSDQAEVIAGIEALDQPLLDGVDIPESQYEALFRVATDLPFRDGALPLVLIATDADFHDSDVNSNYPGAGRTQTLEALKEKNIVVFGLQSGNDVAAGIRLSEVALETNGEVLQLDSSSSQIAQAIADAVDRAIELSNVSLEVLSGADWIRSITPAIHFDVPAGQTVAFELELEGQLNQWRFPGVYDIYLWARSDKTSLIERINQPICPGACLP